MVATAIYQFYPTLDPGSTPDAPQIVDMTIPIYTVDRIEVKIPHGPSGLMGFRLGMGGQQIIPFQAGAWVIGDNDDLTWDLSNQPTSGAWQLIGYNTGIWPHTVYVRFLVEPIGPPPGSSAPLIPIATLNT